MNASLQLQLFAMRSRDEQVRTELVSEGLLFEGYHPRMEAVHRSNAEQLRIIFQKYGWPGEDLVGREAAEAAWLVAQHAIGEPGFMRSCRDLLDEASRTAQAPRWQFAYLDDRINVFEGKPQCYGTQIDLRPEGPAVHELADMADVEVLRDEIGLPSMASALSKAQSDPRPSFEAYSTKQVEALLWRRRVGWVE